ncbi:MAG: carboxypeptidase-like regulatory domain-containing protein [Planctomycetaceae bacterium]|jgi:hypothetical protein|nr:carboxypeptidase-like regulatory domain-containing protein [Planctomycetaceae bacterium]
MICFNGCGKSRPADLPKLYPAVITVLQDGKPLADANVQMVPQTDSKWSAVGVTDANGKVEFFTQGKYKGVPEGTYTVLVSKVFTEPSQYANKPQPANVDYGQWQEMLASEKLKSFNLVDTKFNDKSTSPLEWTTGQKNGIVDVGQSIREEIKPPPM